MAEAKLTKSRRKLLKSIALGGGAIAVGKTLPQSWTRPVVESVMLPAHAIATPQEEEELPRSPLRFATEGDTCGIFQLCTSLAVPAFLHVPVVNGSSEPITIQSATSSDTSHEFPSIPLLLEPGACGLVTIQEPAPAVCPIGSGDISLNVPGFASFEFSVPLP